MSKPPAVSVFEPVQLDFRPILKRLSEDDFFAFCQANSDWRIERTSEGEIIVMPPAGGETGRRNFTLNGLFFQWVEKDGRGLSFDSSTGFTLPNGAVRSPDLAWVRRERWEALSEKQREQFPPLCPDFVAELRSPTDRLEALQAKLEEYVANGAKLGWLIDPFQKKVHVYRPGEPVRVLENPQTVSGEPFLAGFVLDLAGVWG
jgi:Uma2 family endonuclease